MPTLEKPARPEPLRDSSSKHIHRAATDKLRELEFDPIDHMLAQLQEIDALIEREKLSNSRPRLLADLIDQKSRILQTILPYRYGKAPIMTIETEDFREPIKIELTIEEKKSD